MKTTVIGFSDQETLKIALSPNFFIEIYREKIETDSREPLVINNGYKKDSDLQAKSKYDLLLHLCRSSGLKEYITVNDFENKIVNQSHLNGYNYQNYLQDVIEDIESWFYSKKS